MVSEELTNHSKEGTTARETVSWLIRSSVKTEISVPPDLGFTVTMDEFANTLATLSRANQLPTEVSRQIAPGMIGLSPSHGSWWNTQTPGSTLSS